MPLPSSASIISLIFNILRGYDLKYDSLSYHRIIEAFKFAYAQRTKLGGDETPEMRNFMNKLNSYQFGDELRAKIQNVTVNRDVSYYGAQFVASDDHGTANIAVLGKNGDAVVITTTINSRFGAFFRSEQTGIILNNQLDDFSTPGIINAYGIPPSSANFIKPGKRPLSSMSPSIILDSNFDVR